jgi:hypothetical protein
MAWQEKKYSASRSNIGEISPVDLDFIAAASPARTNKKA